MSNFSRNLKNIRLEEKKSQEEVAKKLGISRSTLAMYERGEREPNIDTLIVIADYFKVTTDYLLGGNHKQNKYSYVQAKLIDKVLELSDEKANATLQFLNVWDK